MSAQEVVDWLKSLEWKGISDIKAVRMFLGDDVYEGASYKQTSALDPSCRAYADGQRKVTTEHVYLLGEHPATYRKRGKLRENPNVCYTVDGDDRDWYVAGYWPPLNADQDHINKFQVFHPCGKHFMLCPWDVPDSKIDDYDQTYTRVKIKISALHNEI